MLKIGDFSRISQVSVKTLRYYDEVGLLKPVEVDPFTGYRYYTFDQLPRLYRILALKDLGFSLEEIAGLLGQDLLVAELRGMLRLKRAELSRHVREEQARLERVEARLEQLEQEFVMSNYDVVIKKVDPILVASVRGIIPDFPEQGQLWKELYNCMQQAGVKPSGACFTLYHSEEPEIDAEVCEPLENIFSVEDPVQVRTLPAVDYMASTIHHGPYTTLGEAFGTLLKWIESNGYQITGPSREIYLKEPSPPGNQTDPNTVTEIQFPVVKK